MSLFDGVYNFTPAFEGQKIAMAVGQGAGQSISRGMQVAQGGQKMSKQISALDGWAKTWSDFAGGGPGGTGGAGGDIGWFDNH